MRFQVPKSVPLMGATHTGISTAFPRGQLKKTKGQGSVTSDRYPGHHPPPSTREMNAFLKSYQECSESWGLREIANPLGDPDKRICAALQGVRGAFLALAFQHSPFAVTTSSAPTLCGTPVSSLKLQVRG